MPTTKSAKSSPAKPAVTKRGGGIQITGEGKYPLVPTSCIQIVERPPPGKESEQLFYNPRGLESFKPEEMAEFRFSVRLDGLQTPPLVRAFVERGVVVRVELIAGERRLRSIQYIIDRDLPCLDEDAKRPDKFKAGQVVIAKSHFAKVVEHDNKGVLLQLFDINDKLTDKQLLCQSDDVFPTVPGSVLYEKMPCRVASDISDAKALRLAFTENDKSKSLSTKEEIILVERLTRRGMKVADIAETLGTNETWVSQTANFRVALPKAAFDRLLTGQMKRHVAVHIMGYKLEDRDKLFKATIEAEAEETQERIERADNEAIMAEDDEVLALDDEKKAAKAGDTRTAAKAGKRAAAAATRAVKARTKQSQAEKEAGQIKTGHVARAASTAGLSPKKSKMLSKEDIEERYVVGMEAYLSGDETDPICGEEIPGDYAAIVRITAASILGGQRDPLAAIRQYMVEQEKWEVPDARGVNLNDEDLHDDSGFGGDDDDDFDPRQEFGDQLGDDD